MYQCERERCNKQVPPRTPQNKVVLETRPQVYENKIRRGKDKGKIKKTEGTEIVKEINVCPDCYQEMTGNTPQATRPSRKVEIVDTKRFRSAKDRPYKKKSWKNPKRKDARGEKGTERKKPVIEVVNRLPGKNARS